MNLELKHLAPYLPYKLMFFVDFTDGDTMTAELEGLTDYEIFLDGYESTYNNEHVNPILRPLSDLTKEIEHNGEKFVAIDYFIDSENPYLKDEIIETLTLDKEPYYINYGYATKLISWHFDVFGLIEKGLAIDINTL